MAALGWLLNLDFAGGGTPDEPGTSVKLSERVLRRPSYAYRYGYHHIVVRAGLIWIL